MTRRAHRVHLCTRSLPRCGRDSDTGCELVHRQCRLHALIKQRVNYKVLVNDTSKPTSACRRCCSGQSTNAPCKARWRAPCAACGSTYAHLPAPASVTLLYVQNKFCMRVSMQAHASLNARQRLLYASRTNSLPRQHRCCRPLCTLYQGHALPSEFVYAACIGSTMQRVALIFTAAGPCTHPSRAAAW